MSNLIGLLESTLQPAKFQRENNAKSKGTVDPANFEAQVIAQYSTLFKVHRRDFEFLKECKSELELLAEVDHTSGELTKIKGWLQCIKRDTTYTSSRYYAELSLSPLRTKSGLIYLFTGNIEWTKTFPEAQEQGPRPIHCIPVYGIPSGRIIDLKASAFEDSRNLFGADGGCVKMEYQSFDFKTAR